MDSGPLALAAHSSHSAVLSFFSSDLLLGGGGGGGGVGGGGGPDDCCWSSSGLERTALASGPASSASSVSSWDLERAVESASPQEDLLNAFLGPCSRKRKAYELSDAASLWNDGQQLSFTGFSAFEHEADTNSDMMLLASPLSVPNADLPTAAAAMPLSPTAAAAATATATATTTVLCGGVVGNAGAMLSHFAVGSVVGGRGSVGACAEEPMPKRHKSNGDASCCVPAVACDELPSCVPVANILNTPSWPSSPLSSSDYEPPVDLHQQQSLFCSTLTLPPSAPPSSFVATPQSSAVSCCEPSAALLASLAEVKSVIQHLSDATRLSVQNALLRLASNATVVAAAIVTAPSTASSPDSQPADECATLVAFASAESAATVSSSSSSSCVAVTAATSSQRPAAMAKQSSIESLMNLLFTDCSKPPSPSPSPPPKQQQQPAASLPPLQAPSATPHIKCEPATLSLPLLRTATVSQAPPSASPSGNAYHHHPLVPYLTAYPAVAPIPPTSAVPPPPPRTGRRAHRSSSLSPTATTATASTCGELASMRMTASCSNLGQLFPMSLTVSAPTTPPSSSYPSAASCCSGAIDDGSCSLTCSAPSSFPMRSSSTAIDLPAISATVVALHSSSDSAKCASSPLPLRNATTPESASEKKARCSTPPSLRAPVGISSPLAPRRLLFASSNNDPSVSATAVTTTHL